MKPKQKQCPVVDVTGDGNKLQCYKEQYYIGTWNVKSMNQGQSEVVKQEMQEWTFTFQELVNYNGLERVNLIQMTIISTTVGKKLLEERE